MSDKKTRGRASKVDLLPSHIRQELLLRLRDKSHSQQDILEYINNLIDEAGLSAEMKLSRTGLNRYASRMEEFGAKIRASRQMAEVWTKQLGEMPDSDVGKLLLEFVKTLAFETSMSMSESGKEISPKVLGQLALVAQRIEQAQSVNYKREKEIREDVIAQAAKAIEETGKQSGMAMADVEKMMRAVYGIGE
ncbi:Mu-like prophage FluMu protein gp27 [Gallibacterium salpingitidis]|uniref:Mu-like prophage FluMu protein gp27 n=1 Tax=Gallibacterium salpingitidis TaxID=505341 RepID=A0AB36E0R2_9PAST|nr:DUF3486 family protein [Gallibacterium salpingitidis]OBX08340.1 Mu-like prophage FluMu protein gp27 [Gallibacterium salpingitidis]OBX09354.1 Mu-like prophage FluMu protein gp27 [Gallibacterium salpingitidis]